MSDWTKVVPIIPGQQGPEGPPGNADQSQVNTMVQQFIDANKEQLRGPEGPKGDDGPPGPPGNQPPSGAPGYVRYSNFIEYRNQPGIHTVNTIPINVTEVVITACGGGGGGVLPNGGSGGGGGDAIIRQKFIKEPGSVLRLTIGGGGAGAATGTTANGTATLIEEGINISGTVFYNPWRTLPGGVGGGNEGAGSGGGPGGGPGGGAGGRGYGEPNPGSVAILAMNGIGGGGGSMAQVGAGVGSVIINPGGGGSLGGGVHGNNSGAGFSIYNGPPPSGQWDFRGGPGGGGVGGNVGSTLLLGGGPGFVLIEWN